MVELTWGGTFQEQCDAYSLQYSDDDSLLKTEESSINMSEDQEQAPLFPTTDGLSNNDPLFSFTTSMKGIISLSEYFQSFERIWPVSPALADVANLQDHFGPRFVCSAAGGDTTEDDDHYEFHRGYDIRYHIHTKNKQNKQNHRPCFFSLL